ncbi:hypothetical protein HMPREF3038_00971 [Akkermansia sp. KLE1797]|mgnify:CR=1 FL=1|nr:hypothetical protein HMPREF3038_00971 [Akkermansia sp. KLE1797]KZA04773.1 hypothetical protein HMPREF1326_01349 [Akkermansia sp. KLE1605]
MEVGGLHDVVVGVGGVGEHAMGFRDRIEDRGGSTFNIVSFSDGFHEDIEEAVALRALLWGPGLPG